MTDKNITLSDADIQWHPAFYTAAELDSRKHLSLKVLSRDAKEEDIRRFIEKAPDNDHRRACLHAPVDGIGWARRYEQYSSMSKANDANCECRRR